MIICMLVSTFIYGINTSLEKFVTQAFRRGNLRECALYMHRAIFLNTIVFVPITLILFQTDRILLMLGTTQAVANLAYQYVVWQLPGLLMHGYADSISLMLAAMGFPYIIVILQVIVIPIHVVTCYIFVHKFGFGLVGTAYASNISGLITFLLQFGLGWALKEIQDAWYFPTSETFCKLKEFCSVAIPGCVMLFLEYANWELMMLMAVIMGNQDILAAQIIISTVGSLVLSVPYGLSVSAVAVIGQALGANNA